MTAEGDKLMKQANKLSAPALLAMRMRGDWEQATPLYEKAAVLFKAGCLDLVELQEVMVHLFPQFEH